ncbi:MAG: ion transporter [Candidatus Marinimicrobia bacterium]|nr:ion transporter [Candidatus Neomarinimicrobiota bacterium]
MKIKDVIEKNNTKAGRIFDVFIQLLIVYSIITFSIETLPDLSVAFQRFFQLSEIIVVIIFSLEYLLRIVVTDRKIKYMFSFYGVIDLLAILPFYIAKGIDLRALRIFRLFRITRIFKLMKYSIAIETFRIAFKEIKEELVIFLFMTLLMFYISAVGIYFFENAAQPEQFKSIFHSMWWSIATLTTVGYGDVYPITTGGKIFTFFILIIGLGIVAIPAGLIASALTKVIREKK